MVMADGASVRTEFQSQIADGKYKCKSVLEWGTWSLCLYPLQLRFLGLSRPAVGIPTSLFMMLGDMHGVTSDTPVF